MLRTLLLIITSLLFASSSQATDLDSIYLHIKVDDKVNILHVTETYHLSNDKIMPNWHRVVFHQGIAGRPLLFQRILNANLKDEEGKEYPLEQYSYGRERTHLDYKGNTLKGTCHLSYDVLFYFDGSDKFSLDFPFYDFPLSARYLTIDVKVPEGLSLTHFSWDIDYFDENKEGDYEYADDISMKQISPTVYHLELMPGEGLSSFFEPSLEGTFQFSEALVLEAPTTYEEEWEEQGGAILWFVLGAFILSILLRFMPVVIYPPIIRLYGLALFVLMLVTGYPLYAFFWKATGWSDNFVIELVAQLIFVAAFVLIGYSIHKNLSKRNAQAYYSVLAFPILLLFLLLPASVNPTMYLLLPLAFAPLIFWFQAKNSKHLGVTYYRLIEQVETAGKLTFDDLAQKSGLNINRLLEIIQNIPHHPILIDYESKQFLSTSALALQQKHLLCNNCGAATEVKNEDLINCNHCHTSYRESQKKKSSKPVPEFVELSILIVQNIAYLFFIICGLMLIAITAEFIFDGFDDFFISLATIAVFCGIFAGIGLKLIGMAKNLKLGKSDAGKWCLVPLVLLVTPAIILYKFASSKRIKLHFDNNATDNIESFLKSKGTVSIQELATQLGIAKREALEIADYLCGNNLVQAVFDISNNRIVHRSLWEKLSGTNSCNSCGGLVQIKDKASICMHCGIKT